MLRRWLDCLRHQRTAAKLLGPNRRAGARALRPGVALLESRSLLNASLGINLHTPTVLTPANGQIIYEEVRGIATTNHPNVAPVLRYQVVDQYRQFEPKGRIPLTRFNTTTYIFDYKIPLLASRNTQGNYNPNGRQYDIDLYVTDQDNTFSNYVFATVPRNVKNPPKPNPNPNKGID